MATIINLEGFDNEDNDFAFTLKTGTAEDSDPFDLTDVEFEADVRDTADNSLVLRLTTFEADNRIQKTEPLEGKFLFHIALGEVEFVAKRILKYDLIMHANDTSRRLWGGKLKISKGLTETVEP